MVALMLALQLSATPQTLTPATATIRGHVFAADTGQPLRKAQVRLMQIDAAPQTGPVVAGRENRLATTDADGKYEFVDLPAGRFNLTASKTSYVPASWGQAQPNTPPKPIDVAAGQTIERVDFSLPSGGVVTGRILDEYGEPLAGVQIAAVRSQVVGGQRRAIPTGRMASTNDLGEFRLFGIAPGQYYIQATWRRIGPGDPSSPDQTGYPPTFFPGTTDVTTAQRFTIAAGQTITDLAMGLSPIKTARIEGIVVDSAGRPAPSAMLMLMQVTNGGGSTFATGAPVRPDGAFTLQSVTPGDYVLRAQPRDDRRELATLKLTVGNEDIKDLRLMTVPPSTLIGRIVVDPGEAASLPAALMIAATAVDPTGNMFGIQPARIGDDLSFEITAPIGRMRIVMPTLPPSWAIRSVRVNGLDVTDEGIDVKGDRISDVEVELTTKLASLSGLVTTTAGDPATDYTLILFAADSKRWAPGSRYLRVARPDQQGRFRISSLPAGEYQAIAIDRLEPGQNADPEFLEKVRPRSLGFTLMDGETKTIDLKLNSGS